VLPFYDFIAAPLLGLLALLLIWLQWAHPLRRQHFPFLRRAARNFLFALPALAALRLLLLPIPLTVALWAAQHGFGVLHWLSLPRWLAGVLGFALMDYAYYGWHLATHRVPLLWRFHNVHHTDLDMDVTTAARFHLGEMLLSIPFRVAVVAIFGIGFWALLIYEVCFEAGTQFHHSNWRLPLAVERALNAVVVTPRMHGIHHSIVRDETDSNWGTVFSWWDRLHRTWRLDIAPDDLTIGVPAYRDERELTIGELWKLPFRAQREWKLPDGERPER
jgi:sterol desaturase/sphingolipid hydroxylase (fatty acid hydroxylase superfamily)